MLQLKDIMQHEVVAVAPELSLRELVEVLTERGVSGAPVVANGKVVGVTSAMDILRFEEETAGASESGGEENAALASDGMPREFFSEGWEPSNIDALDRMQSLGSLDRLDEYTVSDVMTRELVSQPSTTSVKKAARYMLDAGVHRLLVIDKGKLEGIVTTTDIVRAVANGKLKG